MIRACSGRLGIRDNSFARIQPAPGRFSMDHGLPSFSGIDPQSIAMHIGAAARAERHNDADGFCGHYCADD